MKAVPLERLTVSAYRVPTDLPESDGTLEWDSTTLVLVEARAAGQHGLGYTYSSQSAGVLIREKLIQIALETDCLDVTGTWEKMIRAIRNLGRPGISSSAVAAVDVALWDLKSRILGLPLVKLLGQVHASMPVYGSGGFTSYSLKQLTSQLSGWASEGISRVKMKIGRNPDEDRARVCAAREAIGPRTELFVDANGAYDRKQALAQAQAFSSNDVSWFEEPVSSDDLEGLRLIRDRAPAGMEIAAGEYGYEALYFRRMLEAGAVDVIQPDATRCAGITGFLQVSALSQAFGIPLSAHTAPSLHLPLCCASARARHLEYFHDHVRIERSLFEGSPSPINGQLHPDLSRPGLGLEFKHSDGKRYEVS